MRTAALVGSADLGGYLGIGSRMSEPARAPSREGAPLQAACVIRSLSVILLLLSDCSTEQPLNKVTVQGAQTMVIEAEIVRIMETWPLQLVVQAPQGLYDVRLLEQTRIVRNDQEVSAGELRPRMKVEISGQGEGTALTAQLIRITDPNTEN